MICTVPLRFDSASVCVDILREDDEPLMGGEGARYRLVAETDDHGEAMAVADLLSQRIGAGEFGRHEGLYPGEQLAPPART